MSEGAKKLAISIRYGEDSGIDFESLGVLSQKGTANTAAKIDAAVAPLVSLLRSRLGHSEDWWTNEPMMNREWRRGAERALEQWRTGR